MAEQPWDVTLALLLSTPPPTLPPISGSKVQEDGGGERVWDAPSMGRDGAGFYAATSGEVCAGICSQFR